MLALTLLVAELHLGAESGCRLQCRRSDVHPRLVAVPGRCTRTGAVRRHTADDGAFGFTRIDDHVIRVQVAGQFGVPGNATAAVLNVTGVNTTAPGFVTVYPAGTDLPTASNVNFDRAGQVMANMVTVKLGAGGAVDVYTQGDRKSDGSRRRRVGCLRAGDGGGGQRPPGDPCRRRVPRARHP